MYARYAPIATGLSGPRFWYFASRSAAKRLLVPLHMCALIFLVTLALLDPSAHLNIVFVLAALVFKAFPGFVQLIGCTIYYRKWRELRWLPVRYIFLNLKHFYGLEAFLSFNARPALTPRMVDALRPRRRERLPELSTELEMAE